MPPSKPPVLYVPVLFTSYESDQNQYARLFTVPCTPSSTLKTLLDLVTQLAKGDLVEYYACSPPSQFRDLKDVPQLCLDRYGTSSDMFDNFARIIDFGPDDTCEGLGIAGSTDVDIVQLFALIYRKSVTGSCIPDNAFAPENILREVRKRPLPPTGAATDLFMKHQRPECPDAAYDSRPLSLMPSPVSIYDRTLAQLSQHLAHPSSEFTFTREELARAKEFTLTSMEWYPTETARQAAFDTDTFNVGGSRMFKWARVSLGDDGANMEVDGDICIEHDGQKLHLMLSEVKNGQGAASPNQVELQYMKLISSEKYARVWRESCCPMILNVMTSDTISIWGAVFADRFMFENLYTIRLGPCYSASTMSEMPGAWSSAKHPSSPSDSSQPPLLNIEPPNPSQLNSYPVIEDRLSAGIREAAKLLRCLDHAVDGLRRYYRGLQLPAQPRSSSRRLIIPSSLESTSREQARFPLWPSFTSGDKHDLLYLVRLADEISKPVFKARMTARTRGSLLDVVVKFAFAYGEEGHRLLATRRNAASLHCCKYARDVRMWVVVMELFVGGSQIVGPCLTCAQSQSLCASLDALYETKLFFGDLREPDSLSESVTHWKHPGCGDRRWSVTSCAWLSFIYLE